ncbi:hypothetical protein XENORESO_020143 [Xenotaenia resolanae]|uniref:Uncharacterized protein n=1 Tax=Xenotaenia resolanae TaxID=208358 RepID=A0ABV0WIJ5_9TELE
MKSPDLHAEEQKYLFYHEKLLLKNTVTFKLFRLTFNDCCYEILSSSCYKLKMFWLNFGSRYQEAAETHMSSVSQIVSGRTFTADLKQCLVFVTWKSFYCNPSRVLLDLNGAIRKYSPPNFICFSVICL